MSTNVAKLRTPEPEPAPAPQLGPAEVLEAGPITLLVALPDGREVEAKLALAFTYAPAAGDTVLVISQREHYVIGVLASRGQGAIAFPGDLELRAGGRLRISGQEGVSIEGRELSVHVGKLELVARAVTQRFESLKQRVTDLLHVHAGASQTVVDGTSHLRAESASILTKEKVTINGKAIHLG